MTDDLWATHDATTPPDGQVSAGESGPEKRLDPAALAAEVDALRAQVRAERRRDERDAELRIQRIKALSDEVQELRKSLTLTRRQLHGLRRRRSVRFALRVANRARPLVLGSQRISAYVRRLKWPRMDPEEAALITRLRATPAEDAAFRSRLAATLAQTGPTEGPLVSAIVVTRNGVGHLRRLLPGLEALAYRSLEVVVVDNASTDASLSYLRGQQWRHPLQIIRNASNHAFSVANNQGVSASGGEFILLINNDVTPAGPHVLGRMIERMLKDDSIVAVASRLIYPRREGPRMGSSRHSADLTLQHRGIMFVADDDIPRARNIGGGEDPLGPEASTPVDVPAATAACLLVRRAAYEAVGGFTEGYDYGTEDVDLCLKLRAAGGRIVYEPEATYWHHESATQYREESETRLLRQQSNRRLFVDRWGPRIFREVLLDRLNGTRLWSEEPIHVGVTLTRDDPAAGWGDWYSAHELGDALAGLGWRVSYLERWQDHWYEPDSSVDVVISLLDALDVRNLPAGIVKIAWVRNWTDRWLDHAWFDEYDLVLASSQRSKELIDQRSVHVAHLMPLATNPVRFSPAPADGNGSEAGRAKSDVVFVGNYWGQKRGVETALRRLVESGRRVALHGRAWDQVPALANVARGPLPYDEVPAAYSSTRVVLDDTAGPTKPYGAVNSRVFDALASGTLVVTDNPAGSKELFDGLLPAAEDAEDLVDLVERYLADDDERQRLASHLQALVLARHTYSHRAAQVKALLTDWAGQTRIDIAIGPPNWGVAETWGDYHFGRALQREMQHQGVPARIRLLPDWDGSATARADVVIQIFGLVERSTRSGQLSVLWIISHPELVTESLVDRNQLIFAASDKFAGDLAQRVRREVIPLHQATDPVRFHPMEGGRHHDLLFVANSRGVRRRIVDELTPTERDLAVYGHGWSEDLLDGRHLKGEHIPNEEVAAYYSAASIVLNDHWPDMAEHGFLSNRLYDASAAGAFVISDWVPGIEEEFDGGIPSFKDGAELRFLIERFLADPAARNDRAGRARDAVLERHTFGHRANQLLQVIQRELEERPPGIVLGWRHRLPAPEPAVPSGATR